MHERRTPQLILRRVTENDLDAFVALETALRGHADQATSAAYLRDFSIRWDGGDLGYWSMRREDRIVGFGGVQPKVWHGRNCWNLYYRVFPDQQGMGLATETARAAIECAGQVQPTWPILVETRPGNTAAIAVAEKVGLRRQPAGPDDESAVLLLENPGTAYPVNLTVRQWQWLDSTMDNEVSTEAENGDPEGILPLGTGIRRAGWDQLTGWNPDVPGSGSWPPDNHLVTVTLSATQWTLACTTLLRWAAYGPDEERRSMLAVRELIEAQLNNHISYRAAGQHRRP